VRFRYGQEQYEEALAGSRAVSYRFLRDAKGWRVFVSLEPSSIEVMTDRRAGAIGIDINPDQLVLAELDRCGNFTGGQPIACVSYGKRPEQAKAIIGDAVKQAIAAAVGSGKPIVLERLEFAEKKSALENEGRGRARMLSGFAYRRVIQPAGGGVSCGGGSPPGPSGLYVYDRSLELRGPFWDQHSSGRGDCDRPPRFSSVGAFGGAGGATVDPPRRFERLFSCFLPWREVHPRLGISRRRVLPEQCMV
jgi:hypothetical protein